MTKLVFVANSIAAVTETTFDGKPYLIAPVVAIKEGVLNEVLYLSADIGQSAQTWNGHVVPINHPQRNGEFISANSPDIWASEVIGNFWNVSLETDKLKGDIWIDLAKAEKIGEPALAVVARLRAGEAVEVSTGLFADVEEAMGIWNGKSYSGIARNIRPDHLALLPNEIGACSWNDGCGVPRVNQKGETMPGELKTNELTLDDRASLVRMAFWDGVRADPYTEAYWEGDWDVISVFAEVLIAKDWNSKSHVAFPYTIDDNGVVTLGAPTPVEVAYQAKDGGAEVVVANTVASAKPSLLARAVQWLKRDKTDSAGGTDSVAVNQQEEIDVAKCDMVAALVANKAVKFSKETLDKWSETDLATLQQSLATNEEAAPAAVVETPVASALPAEWQKAISDLTAKVDVALGAITANADREKNDLVAGLLTNEKNPFDEADLKGMTTAQLQKLASGLQPRDYSAAAGVFRGNSGGQSEEYVMEMPVAWAVAEEGK